MMDTALAEPPTHPASLDHLYMNELTDFAELLAAGLLPEPPTAVQALLPACRADDALEALAHRLQQEPALSNALAALAGHAGGASAATLAGLGPQAVHQLVLGLGVLGNYQRGPCPGFDYPQYASRALAMACAAQLLGGRAEAAQLFCAGLLAGIGKLGLATARPRSYGRLMREYGAAGQRPGALLAMERLRYGYSHLSLGAAMLRHWGAGAVLADAVQHLESPQRAGTRQARRLAWQLRLAELVGQVCAAAPERRADLLPELATVGAMHELSVPALLALTERAGHAWVDWCVALDLPRGAFAAARAEYREIAGSMP